LVRGVLAPAEEAAEYEEPFLHATLVRLQLLFAMAHEFTHVVMGHMITTETGSRILGEIETAVGDAGNLDQQAHEIDADGYATYLVLTDLILGGSRLHVIEVLNLENRSEQVQDEVLFWCFVAAVGGFFCARQPTDVNDIDGLYQLTHPPQAARMNSVMQTAVTHGRSSFVPLSLTPSPRLSSEKSWMLWRRLYGEEVTLPDGARRLRFFSSPQAKEYFSRLDEHVKAYKAPPGRVRVFRRR